MPFKYYRAPDILYDFNTAIPAWSIVAVSGGIQDPVKRDVIHGIRNVQSWAQLAAQGANGFEGQQKVNNYVISFLLHCAKNDQLN